MWSFYGSYFLFNLQEEESYEDDKLNNNFKFYFLEIYNDQRPSSTNLHVSSIYLQVHDFIDQLEGLSTMPLSEHFTILIFLAAWWN